MLAWGSVRGWQAKERAQVRTLLELEAVFTVRGSVGMLRHLLFFSYPFIAWATLVILLVFAIAWLIFLFRE